MFVCLFVCLFCFVEQRRRSCLPKPGAVNNAPRTIHAKHVVEVAQEGLSVVQGVICKAKVVCCRRAFSEVIWICVTCHVQCWPVVFKAFAVTCFWKTCHERICSNDSLGLCVCKSPGFPITRPALLPGSSRRPRGRPSPVKEAVGGSGQTVACAVVCLALNGPDLESVISRPLKSTMLLKNLLMWWLCSHILYQHRQRQVWTGTESATCPTAPPCTFDGWRTADPRSFLALLPRSWQAYF